MCFSFEIPDVTGEKNSTETKKMEIKKIKECFGKMVV